MAGVWTSRPKTRAVVGTDGEGVAVRGEFESAQYTLRIGANAK
jgi:hypothetical protein